MRCLVRFAGIPMLNVRGSSNYPFRYRTWNNNVIASHAYSNKTVKLSARHVVFQVPGSGQEFAAAIISGPDQVVPAAQFLPLRLGSRLIRHLIMAVAGITNRTNLISKVRLIPILALFCWIGNGLTSR